MDEQGEAVSLEGPPPLEQAVVWLARALTCEDLGARLNQLAQQHLPCEEVAIYARRGQGYELLSASGAPLPRRLPGDFELPHEPELVASPPWCPWEQPLLLPLQGRNRRVGVLIARVTGTLPPLRDPSLGILQGVGGALLEGLLADERRTHAVLRRSTRRGVARPRSTRAIASNGNGNGVPNASGDVELIGRSPALDQVQRMITRVARVDSPVLLLGETGTGKSLVANAIHKASGRSEGPFVVVNCAAIPKDLAESEFFGHVKGAFTGALREHRGRVEQANGGTLFLDEVGELSASAQGKLLLFLEERRYCPVGSERERRADVRVVAATNRDLEADVSAGSFRQDLLYRLNVFPLTLAPLRQRGEDVLLLASHFLERIAKRYELPQPSLTAAAMQRLREYSWPGNLRELRNVLEKALVMADEDVIGVDLLPSQVLEGGPPPSQSLPSVSGPGQVSRPASGSGALALPCERGSLLPFHEAKKQLLESWERNYLELLLEQTGGNVASAARFAGLNKRNLHRKLRQHGIERLDFVASR